MDKDILTDIAEWFEREYYSIQQAFSTMRADLLRGADEFSSDNSPYVAEYLRNAAGVWDDKVKEIDALIERIP